MDVQTNQKNPQQQKQEDKVLADIQCQQFGQLLIWKTRTLYIWGKIIMKKFGQYLKEQAKIIIDSEKKHMPPLTKRN